MARSIPVRLTPIPFVVVGTIRNAKDEGEGDAREYVVRARTRTPSRRLLSAAAQEECVEEVWREASGAMGPGRCRFETK